MAIRDFDPEPYDLEALEKEFDSIEALEPADVDYPKKKFKRDFMKLRILAGVQARTIGCLLERESRNRDILDDLRRRMASLNHVVTMMGEFERIKKELHELRTAKQE